MSSSRPPFKRSMSDGFLLQFRKYSIFAESLNTNTTATNENNPYATNVRPATPSRLFLNRLGHSGYINRCDLEGSENESTDEDTSLPVDINDLAPNNQNYPTTPPGTPPYYEFQNDYSSERNSEPEERSRQDNLSSDEDDEKANLLYADDEESQVTSSRNHKPR